MEQLDLIFLKAKPWTYPDFKESKLCTICRTPVVVQWVTRNNISSEFIDDKGQCFTCAGYGASYPPRSRK
jgi:hypothetical protein